MQKPSTWGRRVKCGGRTAKRLAKPAQVALPWICHLFQHLAQASPPLGVPPTLCGNSRTAPDSNDVGECWGLGFLASHLLAQHRHLCCSWPALFFVASGCLSRSLPQGAAISVAVGWACWANCFRWRYQEVQNKRKMWERSSFIRQLVLQAVNAQSHRNRTLWAPQEKRWPQLNGSRPSKLNTK